MTLTSPPLRAYQARVMQRLRWALFRNGLGQMVSHSFVRLLTILLCCLLIWGTLFAVSYLGFHELRRQWRLTLDEQPIVMLLNLSFMVLAVLLVFSTGIILYSSLFNSRETSFLLVSPVRPDQIFAYKFQGAVAFSSWAFLLLGSPILLAYGLEVGGGAPWFYYVLLPLYFLGFVLIPGSVGALICILLAAYFPRHRKQMLALFTLTVVVMVGWWGYSRLLPSAGSLLSDNDALTRLLGEVSVVHSPFLPAYWLAEGVRSAALGEAETALYYLALIWSNGLFLYVLAAWAAARLYRRCYNLLASSGGLRRSYGSSWMDHALGALLCGTDRQTRTLILKDFRSFRRDPAQWAQILILLGLAALYLLNIRQFYRQDIAAPFRNGISLLNLTATSFLMCAYTGRFIYPMLSLEGSKFWILGLLPLQRSRLVLGKFLFSAVGTLLCGEALVLFSDFMLNMSWPLIGLHALTVAILALGLSGLSVGLGASMPNFRETDPSKIAVGFGGTVMLVLGLLFQVLVILVTALPWHLLAATRETQEPRTPPILYVGLLVGLLIGGIAVVVPLRVGARALEKMEF